MKIDILSLSEGAFWSFDIRGISSESLPQTYLKVIVTKT